MRDCFAVRVAASLHKNFTVTCQYWYVLGADGLTVGASGSNADVAAAATITDLQQASKALQGKGGLDPFPAAMQVPPLPQRCLVVLPLVHHHAGALISILASGFTGQALPYSLRCHQSAVAEPRGTMEGRTDERKGG